MAPNSRVCSACGTQLTGPVAQSLFRTLTAADGLVAQLATLSANATAARTAPQPVTQEPRPTQAAYAPQPAPGTMLPPDLGPFPAARAHDVRRPEWPAPRTSGLSTASVPKILLGLGALCLLVAAIVFLAVAWSLLGVGGRTVVLILLTVGAGALGGLLAHRGLRGGAEAFLTVSLGLLTLDVFGARSSGWLDVLDEPGFVAVLGAALAVAGLGSAWFLRRFRTGPLVSTQLIGAVGLGFGTSGLIETIVRPGQDDVDLMAVCAVIWLVLLAGGAFGAHLVKLPVAAIALVCGVGLAWLELVIIGFIRLSTPLTFANVWSGFHPWPTVLAALMVAALAWFGRSLPLAARVLSAAVAVALLTLLLGLPAIGESMNTLVLVGSAMIVVGALATTQLARAWRPVLALPVGVATCGLLAPAAIFGSGALGSLFFDAPWAQRPGATLPRAEFAELWPVLVPVVVGMLLLGAWVAVNLGADVPVSRVALPMVMLVAASALAVPTAYGVGLGVMVGLLLVAAAAFSGASLTTDPLVRRTALVVGALLAATALLVSLQSQALTAVTTGLLTLGAVALTLTRHPGARLVGDLAFAPAAGVFLWTVLDLVGLDAPWRALPMLVVIGGWAVLGARPEREVPAGLAMFTTVALCVGGVEQAQGWSAQTWLALDLTLGGVLVHVSALWNAHRRWFGWIGLGLMVLAQWVRLAEIGVETVEAYTLPLAVVLLVVGALRMRNSSMRSVPALAPGLALALVPSFFIALVEPVSLRALLLGIACLAIAVAGAGLRWSAPLVAGAVIGAPLALREVTHAVTLPQWLVIGLIGVVLTVVGVTWERSLNEVRQATGFLRRLR